MKKSIERRMFTSIERWQQSGLKQNVWCKKNDIHYATFHYWYKRYRSKTTDLPAISPGFVPVMMNMPAATGIPCELSWPDGKRLTFLQPVSADFLRTLIG